MKEKRKIMKEAEAGLIELYKKREAVWRHLRPYKAKIYKTIAYSITLSVLGALGPFALGQLYDQSDSFSGKLLFASIVALYIIFTVRDYFDTRLSQNKEEISFECEVDFKVKIYKHLNHVPYLFHQNNDIGGINNKIDRAASYMYYLINEVLFLVLPEALLSIAVFFMLLKVNYLFSLIMFLMLAMHAILNISTSERKVEWEQDRRDKDNILASYIHDAGLNLSSIKSLGIEDAIESEYRRLGDDIKLSVQAFLRKIFMREFLQKNILTLGTVAAYGLFFFLSKEGKISTGGIIMVLSYTAMLIGPFSSLSRQYSMFRRAMVHIAAANEILDESEESNKGGEIELYKGTAIEFKNVYFSPNGSGETICDVSMEIPDGPGLYAIVGESGSGKTTWWKLLLRHYDRCAGEIVFNGANNELIKISSLKKHILSVERTFLFNKSPRFNVAVGNSEAAEKDILKALYAVGLGYLIEREGLDSSVCCFCKKVSPGEVQRILIARMLLNKTASVFILDEPTQALDSKNSAKIMEILQILSLTKKVIVITHDLKHIAGANKIFVMEGGKLIEQGTHKELMDQKGKYAEHFAQQKKI